LILAANPKRLNRVDSVQAPQNLRARKQKPRTIREAYEKSGNKFGGKVQVVWAVPFLTFRTVVPSFKKC
jgi:hypothetical protein